MEEPRAIWNFGVRSGRLHLVERMDPGGGQRLPGGDNRIGEVDVDAAVRRDERARLAVELGDERLVRLRVREHPELPELVGPQRALDELLRVGVHAPLESRRDAAESARQDVLRDVGHVHLREQRRRDLVGDGRDDGVVLRERRHRPHVAVRVQHLAAQPERRDRERRQERRRDHEHRRRSPHRRNYDVRRRTVIDRGIRATWSRGAYVAGPASGSAVVSSSSQRVPKRLGGSVKVVSSWWALKRIRNESSTTGSPCAVARPERLAVQEHAEPRRRRLRPSRACVILRPSGRNHQTSGSPVAGAVADEEASSAGRPGARCRSAISRRVNSSSRSLPLVRGPSRSTRSRCPGSTRCCCRPGCGAISSPPSSIGTPCERNSVARKFRCWRSRSVVDLGVVGRPLDAAVPAAVVVGAVAVVLEVRLVVLLVVRDEVARA